VGTDAAGRRQYRYHDGWRRRRDQEKFDHMGAFARCLPELRARCHDLLTATDETTRDRVLAGAVRLLDLGFFRVGGEEYAEEHQTYGLATIRKSHVHVQGDEVTFDYVAKSGRQRIQTVVDPEVTALVAALKRRRSGGPELLAWRDAGGPWHDVRSHEINAFLQQMAGIECSAKDFRTWSATVLAAVALAVSVEVCGSKTARKRAVNRMYQEVSTYLGNTPAVCRSSYVDPRVVDRFRAGATILPALGRLGADCRPGSPSTHGDIEDAVLGLLAGDEVAGLAA
jgi:DNA topoisomerase IB